METVERCGKDQNRVTCPGARAARPRLIASRLPRNRDFAWVAVLLVVGCHRNLMDAGSLPPSMCANPTVNVQGLDLSKLARPQPNGKVIQPGDQLEMTVVSGADDDTHTPFMVTIGEDGNAVIPLVGPVRLIGMETNQAMMAVRDASIQRGIYREPSVSLSVKSRETNRITVMGAVVEPGTYELPVSGSDLLSAIMLAGGLKDNAGPIVRIQHARRPSTPAPQDEILPASFASGNHPYGNSGPGTVEIDLISATQGGQQASVLLGDGDVVSVIEQEERFVYVMGLVRKPDRYELKPGQDITVLDALALAGGATESIADKVLVVRAIPGQAQPAMIGVSIREAKRNGAENMLLASGDVVTVEETPVTFVVGAIKQIIRVGVNGSISAF